ncbi:translation initiation factor IF-2-like [Trachemys scripta elegans]|uniref:translation initiation factor IF-2-like n=1 Tax=Trachemys scripta elegans TaxID=31138 RepID=UPI0015523D15|nr:translation initiation factor IF-2-like [Trachemys scripta elegans]
MIRMGPSDPKVYKSSRGQTQRGEAQRYGLIARTQEQPGGGSGGSDRWAQSQPQEVTRSRCGDSGSRRDPRAPAAGAGSPEPGLQPGEGNLQQGPSRCSPGASPRAEPQPGQAPSRPGPCPRGPRSEGRALELSCLGQMLLPPLPESPDCETAAPQLGVCQGQTFIKVPPSVPSPGGHFCWTWN